MANPFYIKITGEKQGEFTGDVDLEGREGMILGYRFENSVSVPRDTNTGQATGKRVHKPIRFTKHVDGSSPLLWMALVRSESLTEVIFDFYRINASGENVNYYSVQLKNAQVVQMSTDLADTAQAVGLESDLTREHVELTYQEIIWEHKDAGTMSQDQWKQTI